MIRAAADRARCSRPPRPQPPQTIAITGGMVALGDGSRADPRRHRRHPQRPHRRGRARTSAIPARRRDRRRARQMGDAGHRRRLLAHRPQPRSIWRPTDRRRHQADDGPFSAAIDVAPAINPLGLDHRRQPRRRRHPGSGRAGRRARASSPGRARSSTSAPTWTPITARPAVPVRRAGRDGRGHTPAARAPRRIVLFRNALREAAELRRYAVPFRRRAGRESPTVRSSAIPTNREYGPTPAAARTCC